MLACEEPRGSQPAAPADTAQLGECGTWRNIGQPFTLNYCTGCHASGRVGGARHDAPVGVDFDTLSAVQAQAAVISVRVAPGGDMPPGGGPSAAERTSVVHWLECGAPGDASALPTFENGVATDAAIWETRVAVDGDALRVEATSDGRVVHDEWYRVTGQLASFVGWAAYDADGATQRGQEWDPPLPIWTLDAQPSVVVTEATTSLDGESEVATEEWTIDQRLSASVDARAQDQAPQESVAVEAAGETWGWQYSDAAGPVAHWHTRGERARMLLRQEIAPPPDATTPFPVSAGMFWPDRVVSTEDAP